MLGRSVEVEGKVGLCVQRRQQSVRFEHGPRALGGEAANAFTPIHTFDCPGIGRGFDCKATLGGGVKGSSRAHEEERERRR